MTRAASRRTLVPLVLRTALLVGLAVALLIGVDGTDGPPGTTLLRGNGGDVEALTDLLLAPSAAAAPAAVLRPAGTPPTESELALLAPIAERSPLTVGLPAGPLPVRVIPPMGPRVGRFSAVRFMATAAPGDTVVARLVGAGGVVDSVRVAAGEDPAVEGAFRVRPGVAGWKEWTVSVGPAATGTAGAWVTEADAPRVLVVAGPPSWESRYAVRALERSGVELALVQHLGRDNVITSGGATAAWWEPSSLAGYDAVVLLAGAAAGPGALDALKRWTYGGRGVLASSEAIDALGLGALSTNVDEPVAASSLEWTAPAEIAPLPAADVDAAVTTFDAVPAVATVAARTADGRPFLVFAPVGRGRLVGLGPLESWRWVLDAGEEAGHRAFWRSLVDWVAAPAADSLGLRVEPGSAPVGATVDVRSRAEKLQLHRPDGSVEALAGAAARFVADDTGTYAVRADTAVLAAFRAAPGDEAPPAELARARLSLLAMASGGAVLSADDFDARRSGAPGGDGASGSAPRGPAPIPGGWPVLLFVVLVTLAVAEWAVRRLRGLV